MQVFDFIQSIINVGVKSKMNYREKRLIQIINVASLATGFFIWYLAITYFLKGILIPSRVNMLIGSVYLFNVYWTYTQRLLLAKIVLVYTAFLIPVIGFFMAGFIPAGQYFSLMVIGFAFMNVAALVFDIRTERKMYIFTILFIGFWVYFSDKIFYFLSDPKPDISFIEQNYFFYKLPVFFAAILVSVLLLTFKNIIFSYERENDRIKGELNDMNEELLKQNETLELYVQERTRKLSATTSRIFNLANITSHKIRGPLATIMGVTLLLKSNINDEEVQNVLPKLHDRCLEMDKVIREMADVLDETDQTWATNSEQGNDIRNLENEAEDKK